jgi:hypothetical protein
MTRRFAVGKKSKAYDDRTGRKVDYKDLRREWNGLWVHKDEWENKHPQLKSRGAYDAEALRNPRPDLDREITHVRGRSIQGVQGFGYIGAQPDPTTHIGVGIILTGIEGTGEIGTEVPTASSTPSGISATGAIGSIAALGTIIAGVSATGAIGNSTYTAMDLPTGVEGTGAIGSIAALGTIIAGVSATGAIGTALPGGWGMGGWGNALWGDHA